MSGRPETLTSELTPARLGLAPHLFLISNCDRPTDNSQRLSLQGIEQLTIRRGDGEPASGSRIVVDGTGIEIHVTDAWMSTTHATLRRIRGAWSLEDSGSRNGTLLNGRVIRRETLTDGDLIETGHTFFLFRASLPSAVRATVLDAGSLRPAAPGLATLSPSLSATFHQVEAVSRSSIPVLLRGESGTGKEVVAAALHALSDRLGPFQPVNCGALSLPLMQAELFGHPKESRAGETDDSLGLIRAAEGGTLFLDEVGDLALPAQSLLLRVLQDGEVFPVGASRPIRVHVRVVAATNQDLEVLAAGSRFRTDLLARMSGFTLTLPALRDRREDLGMLIGAFLNQQAGEVPASFTSDALRAMLLYRWPLNIRELEKTVQAAAILARQRPVALEDLPAAVRASLQAKPGETQGSGRPAVEGPAAGDRFVGRTPRHGGAELDLRLDQRGNRADRTALGRSPVTAQDSPPPDAHARAGAAPARGPGIGGSHVVAPSRAALTRTDSTETRMQMKRAAAVGRFGIPYTPGYFLAGTVFAGSNGNAYKVSGNPIQTAFAAQSSFTSGAGSCTPSASPFNVSYAHEATDLGPAPPVPPIPFSVH